MFNLVSFDTSSSAVHIALLSGEFNHPPFIVADQVIETNLQATGAARQEAGNLLIPTIDRLVKAHNWAKSEIDCIVVGSGPGSFTGIRTSIVTARALSQALCLPLVAVSLIDCYFADLEPDALVILQAASGFYYLAEIDCETTNSSYLNEPTVLDFLQLQPLKPCYADSVACANLALRGQKLQCLPAIANVAVLQATIAWHRLSGQIPGESSLDQNTDSNRKRLRQDLSLCFPYESATPTYLRNPSVTVKKAPV